MLRPREADIGSTTDFLELKIYTMLSSGNDLTKIMSGTTEARPQISYKDTVKVDSSTIIKIGDAKVVGASTEVEVTFPTDSEVVSIGGSIWRSVAPASIVEWCEVVSIGTCCITIWSKTRESVEV